ncbi:MAG: ATPase, T2SS/T4P/T4SS family, partial [Phycisphaeraceae bacterium]|nr:ATPase, T2SS/T4P/T4SS family [Phycisphaeraceae bacterium]
MTLIGRQAITIGRADDNRIVLTDDHLVSRHHCVIELREEGVRVRDLDSRNGTKVNETEVREAWLEPGDEIRVGKTRFRYSGPGEGEAVVRRRKSSKSVSDKGLAANQSGESAVDRLSASAASLRGEEVPGAENSTEPAKESDPPVKALTNLGPAETPTDFTDDDITVLTGSEKPIHAGADFESGDTRLLGQGLRVLRQVLLIAVRSRATDLHLAPDGERYRLRLRIDGQLVDALSLRSPLGRLIQGIIETLAEIPETDDGLREGRFAATMPDRRVDYRVSFTPLGQGQKLVVRVLDPVQAPQSLDELALPATMARPLKDLVSAPSGLMITCGPTGAGKTTTLYAALRGIDLNRRHVITIEDPIEYHLPGASQLAADPSGEMTLSRRLQSVLRQDPDVLMICEIRDAETARFAMEAAST